MKSNEIIEKSREEGFPVKSLIEYFEYSKGLNTEKSDKNIHLRTKIVDDLLSDFTNSDIELIRLLFDEELKCELEIQKHDNLYQLSFYLYSLANLQDVYRIYDIKFNLKNMDVGILIDREMLYMSHKLKEVIVFVKNDSLNKNPEVLKTLIDLKNYPDYESEEAYSTFINGYFYGHKSKLIKNRSWWKIRK